MRQRCEQNLARVDSGRVPQIGQVGRLPCWAIWAVTETSRYGD